MLSSSEVRTQDVDHEHQGRARRDVLALALVAVAELRRDDEHDAAADGDSVETLDPAVDEAALARIRELAETFLANTVIEDFVVRVEESAEEVAP